MPEGAFSPSARPRAWSDGPTDPVNLAAAPMAGPRRQPRPRPRPTL